MRSQGMSRYWMSAILAVAVGMVVVVGCRQEQSASTTELAGDHGHSHEEHEHKLSYAEAVERIKQLRDSIRASFADGKLAEADSAVHEIGHLLEEITDLATHENLADEVVNEIKQGADRAFEAYSQLDTLIHGSTDATKIAYEDFEEDIESGIATLEAKLALINMDATHDHDDEGGHENESRDDNHDQAQ